METEDFSLPNHPTNAIDLAQHRLPCNVSLLLRLADFGNTWIRVVTLAGLQWHPVQKLTNCQWTLQHYQGAEICQHHPTHGGIVYNQPHVRWCLTKCWIFPKLPNLQWASIIHPFWVCHVCLTQSWVVPAAPCCEFLSDVRGSREKMAMICSPNFATSFKCGAVSGHVFWILTIRHLRF